MKTTMIYNKKEDKYRLAIVFDADDEEPDCMKCRYVENDDICEQCGNWWRHYERIELLDNRVEMIK